MLRLDCSVVVDFQTTHFPWREKTATIVKDRKKVLFCSFVVTHLHIVVVQ
jgi:hypothetical protein